MIHVKEKQSRETAITALKSKSDWSNKRFRLFMPSAKREICKFIALESGNLRIQRSDPDLGGSRDHASVPDPVHSKLARRWLNNKFCRMKVTTPISWCSISMKKLLTPWSTPGHLLPFGRYRLFLIIGHAFTSRTIFLKNCGRELNTGWEQFFRLRFISLPEFFRPYREGLDCLELKSGLGRASR